MSPKVDPTPGMVARQETPPEPRNAKGVPFQFQTPDTERTVYLVAIGFKPGTPEEDGIEYLAGDDCLHGRHPVVFATKALAVDQVQQQRGHGFRAELIERTEKIIPLGRILEVVD